jgi:hypothetical protein
MLPLFKGNAPARATEIVVTLLQNLNVGIAGGDSEPRPFVCKNGSIG